MSFDIGAAGVDIFFVISGFIMWVISVRAPLGPGDFLLRRVVRIVPLYWLTTLGVVVLAMLWPHLFPVMKVTTGHVVQSLLFLPHRDPNGDPAPVIAPGWTLNYEAFFYVLFALGLWVFAQRRALFVSLALGALALAGFFADQSNPILNAYTDPILLEFAAGVWLGAAWTAQRLPGPGAGLMLLVAGAAAFAVELATRFKPDHLRPLLWGLPAFALVAGAVSAERAGLVLRGRAFARVGDASYSIYLVHGLMVSLAARLLALVGVNAGPAVLIGAIGCGLLGGLVCYHLIERPLTRALHRALRPAVVTPAPSAA